MKYKFDIDKFINMILFFYENTNEEKFAKTKALKLIFFSDFWHVREFARPITGDAYYHLPRGPIPTMAKDLLDLISRNDNNDTALDEGTIRKLKEAIKVVVESATDYTKFRIVGKKKCDHSHFSQSELDIMKKVSKKFYNIGGTELSERTHREPAWKNTSENDQIDYIYAFASPEDDDKRVYYEFWKKEYTELEYMLSHA